MRAILRKILWLFAAMLAIAVIAEIGLRAFGPYPVTRAKPRKVYDADFGYRLNPDHPAVSAAGFKPSAGSGRPTVAAIGDGLTYGEEGTGPESSWPAKFAALTGRGTSNFGIGSYGVYTYYAVARHAISQGYSHVIIALQVQNDFAPAGTSCAIDYDGSPLWRDAVSRLSLNLPECSLAETWKTSSAPSFMQKMYGRWNIAVLQAMKYGFPEPDSEEVWTPPAGSAPGGQERQEARADSEKDRNPIPAGQVKKKPASYYFNEAALRVTREDFAYSDLENPQTRAVVEDFEKLIADLKARADSAGTKLGVLLIPPKTQIIYEYAEPRDFYGEAAWFGELAENEIALENRISAHLTRHGIPWRSAREELFAALAEGERNGERVFGLTGGHPYASGRAAYARAAVALFAQLNRE